MWNNLILSRKTADFNGKTETKTWQYCDDSQNLTVGTFSAIIVILYHFSLSFTTYLLTCQTMNCSCKHQCLMSGLEFYALFLPKKCHVSQKFVVDKPINACSYNCLNLRCIFTKNIKKTITLLGTFVVDINWHMISWVDEVHWLSVERIIYKVLSTHVNRLAKKRINLLQSTAVALIIHINFNLKHIRFFLFRAFGVQLYTQNVQYKWIYAVAFAAFSDLALYKYTL